MTVSSVLVAARDEYDAGSIDNQGFTDAVNGILDSVATGTSDADKIAAFDRIAQFIAENYRIDELDGGVQYIKSDLDHYFFEETLGAVLGEDIWDGFYNKTYESC